VARSLGQAPPKQSFPCGPLIVLIGAGVLFVAMLAEIVLRVGELRVSNFLDLECAGSQAVLQGQKGLFELDTESGFKMRPNVCVRLRSTEYNQVLRTNNRGFVGPDVPDTKPPDEFRIVVLGDSYTAGGQVPYEQNYTALVQDRLRADGYAHVRVINAGIGGCGTFCQAGVLHENVGWMRPDLVVVAVFVGNNIAENVLAVHGGYREAPEHPKGVTWGPAAAELLDASGAWFPRNGLPASQPPPPWDTARPLPTPVGNSPPGTAPYVRSLDTSAGAGLLGEVRQLASAAWNGARSHSLLLGDLFALPVDTSVSTAPGAAAPSRELKRLNLSSFEWTILRSPPHMYWLDVAWPLFGSYLENIRATAAAAGARTIVMVIPQLAQFDENAREREMADFRFQDDEVDWDRPQQQVQLQAAAHGLPVLDLLPLFRARPDRGDLYLRIDTHFTALGHAVVAEQLATFVEARGWLDG
jgi:lysophospholipase L1-like esterase